MISAQIIVTLRDGKIETGALTGMDKVACAGLLHLAAFSLAVGDPDVLLKSPVPMPEPGGIQPAGPEHRKLLGRPGQS